MKYFKENSILLSDFDGVLLDTQSKFNEVMKDETDFNLWNNYLNGIDWNKFYKTSDEIPNAKHVLKELEKLKILKGFITKIHSLYEGEEKLKIIRKMNFSVPIYYVLPKQRKSEVYKPDSNIVLLDDGFDNVVDWEMNGGSSILYNHNTNHAKKIVINNMTDLLK